MSRESESEREERKILPTFKWNGVTFLFEWGFYILKEGNKMAEVDAIFPPFFQSGLCPWKDNTSMLKIFRRRKKRTGSSINDVILERRGGSDEKNHHYVCLPLALGAVHKCCHFLVGRGGRPKSDQMWWGRGGSAKSSKNKVTSTVLERTGGHA